MRQTIALFCLAFLTAGSAQAAAPDAAWFQKTTQALFDALAPGDKTPWEQTLADGCIITDEDGHIQSKAELLKDFSPLPPGFSGKIVIRDLKVQDLGDAAVAHYRLVESEDVMGQKLHTDYLTTDTYRETPAGWKIVASQVTVVPRDLDPVSVDPRVFAPLVGTYKLTPTAPNSYVVFIEGQDLYGGRDQRSATRLIPLSPQVYFQAGSIHTMIFVVDAAGAVTEVREVHKYNELAYRRIPAAR